MRNDNMKKGVSYPVINKEACKGCGRCILGCPKNALSLSNEINSAGYQYSYYKGEGCTGCKDCFFTCPEPFALEVHSYKNTANNKIGKMIKYKSNNKRKNNE